MPRLWESKRFSRKCFEYAKIWCRAIDPIVIRDCNRQIYLGWQKHEHIAHNIVLPINMMHYTWQFLSYWIEIQRYNMEMQTIETILDNIKQFQTDRSNTGGKSCFEFVDWTEDCNWSHVQQLKMRCIDVNYVVIENNSYEHSNCVEMKNSHSS